MLFVSFTCYTKLNRSEPPIRSQSTQMQSTITLLTKERKTNPGDVKERPIAVSWSLKRPIPKQVEDMHAEERGR